MNNNQITDMLSDSSCFIFSMDFVLKAIKSYLTIRQFNIVSLKMKNYKNIEIAKKLEVSPATITIEFEKIRKIITKYNLL